MSNSNPQPTTSINEILEELISCADKDSQIAMVLYADQHTKTALYTLIASSKPDYKIEDIDVPDTLHRNIGYNQALQDYDNAIKDLLK